MHFSRFFSLVGFVFTAGSALVAAAPALSSDVIVPRCSSGCTSGTQVLGLVTQLQIDVAANLSLLDKCKSSGPTCNPTDIFNKLAKLANDCSKAIGKVENDTTGGYNNVKSQVSSITAKIILDISTGCSKYQNVKINGFVYVDLCAKIDLALKGLCSALDTLINGCLKLISSM